MSASPKRAKRRTVATSDIGWVDSLTSEALKKLVTVTSLLDDGLLDDVGLEAWQVRKLIGLVRVARTHIRCVRENHLPRMRGSAVSQ